MYTFQLAGDLLFRFCQESGEVWFLHTNLYPKQWSRVLENPRDGA